MLAQGRPEQALAATTESEQASSADDVHAEIAWRVARAKACASLQRGAEAERVGREAVQLAGTTDSPVLAADALLALAEALAVQGAWAEARASATNALRLYEAKGSRAASRLAVAFIESTAARRSLTGA